VKPKRRARIKTQNIWERYFGDQPRTLSLPCEGEIHDLVIGNNLVPLAIHHDTQSDDVLLSQLGAEPPPCIAFRLAMLHQQQAVPLLSKDARLQRLIACYDLFCQFGYVPAPVGIEHNNYYAHPRSYRLKHFVLHLQADWLITCRPHNHPEKPFISGFTEPTSIVGTTVRYFDGIDPHIYSDHLNANIKDCLTRTLQEPLYRDPHTKAAVFTPFYSYSKGWEYYEIIPF
jgi:hypothetical protein